MKRNQRLSIVTPENTLNDEFVLTCSFMDIMIHDWSDEQAEAMFLNLTGKNQMEISQMLGISQPAVNRRLKAAHFDTIHKFINRFEQLLKSPKPDENYPLDHTEFRLYHGHLVHLPDQGKPAQD